MKSRLLVSLIHKKPLPAYHLEHFFLQQPLDHSHPDGSLFSQRIDILIPQGAGLDSPVLFILGGESAATRRRLVQIYQAYGQRADLILIQAEHRGYGESLSLDADQSIPAYVTVNQALADYHAVIQHLQKTYTGPWMAAGYSYSGGLVIDLAARYPGCLAGILSSSGVVDWHFTMTAYDARVRITFGQAVYQRLADHIHHLQPEKMFDRNWLEREFLIAFIHGVSQFSAYEPYRGLFRFLVGLPTPILLFGLHAIDRLIARQGGWHYAISNAKLTLTRAEALTMNYTWRTWRYQQANEVGIYEVSLQPGGIFNRQPADFIAEAQALFGPDQPRSASAQSWSPRSSLDRLDIPLVYVAGECDPWEGLGLERNFPLRKGRYFFVPGGLHCPDLYDPALGKEVIAALLSLSLPAQPDNRISRIQGGRMKTNPEYNERMKNLQAEVAQRGLDAFLVTAQDSIYYLTGVTYMPLERPFFILVKPGSAASLLAPALDREHLAGAPNVGSVSSYWDYPSPPGQGWHERLLELLDGVRQLGVEPSLPQEIASQLAGFSFQVHGLVEKLRLVKSPQEIARLRQAAHYADLGMEKILAASYYGVSEIEVFSQARAVQMKIIKETDFDPLNTSLLTAAWPARLGTQPHGVPSVADRLQEGPHIALSFMRVNGYGAECERTFFVAAPSGEMKEKFAMMQEARRRAFALIRPGVPCAEIDLAANGFLRQEGYADYLLHRTGHGFGLGNHEGPWVAEGSEDVLSANMLISVEPGIYIPGLGGFRHSDTVLVTDTGYERLTTYPEALEQLTIGGSKFFTRLRGAIVRKAVGI